jgi:predicted CoA-binding protein
MDAATILRSAKTVAVVGLSDKPERPSFDVAGYLLDKGYRIIPVNPNIREWKGIRAYGSLLEIPRNIQVDIVDIFRKSGDVPLVVDEAIEINAKTIWMQIGIVNGEAAEKARRAGLGVVMDKCMKIEHMKMKD